MNKTIIEQINDIDSEIGDLQTKKALLVQKLSKSDSFVERLRAWSIDEDRINYRSLIDKKEHPKLRGYYDEHRDMNRYRTYFIEDDFEDELYTILDSEYDWQNPDSEFYIPQYKIDCLEEAIKTKLASFICDW